MSAEVHILGERPSLLSQFLAEIRDSETQRDALRFRRNIERIGEIMAYEISQALPHRRVDVTTPLGVARCHRLEAQPVLATILRAGLPLHQGLLNYFDRAENTFISAYRKHEGNDEHFEVEIEYLSSPPLEGKTVILSDPMLASGSSMVLAYQALLERGTPGQLHVAVVIASEEGIEFARRRLPDDTTIWAGAVDAEMTPRKYIVPGLGDAGDLAYGAKE
ncbi:MAG: uracil phosphoribosyltransferase [Xanthomonadales bacterium]|nr:uracil phosphoribosyltransferase [Xanthomonadales bacterium]